MVKYHLVFILVSTVGRIDFILCLTDKLRGLFSSRQPDYPLISNIIARCIIEKRTCQIKLLVCESYCIFVSFTA